MLLLGEIDLDRDDVVPAGYELAPIEKVHALAREEKIEKKGNDKKRQRKLFAMGFEGEAEVVL